MLRRVLILWVFLLPVDGLACSCAFEKLPLQEAVKQSLSRSDSVVLAKVISIEKYSVELLSGESIPPDAPLSSDITQFEVIQSWKGNHNTLFHTRINTACCMCGYVFSEGETYLLYLYGPDEYGYYSTSTCSRSKPLKQENKEIAVLNHLLQTNQLVSTQ